MLIIFLYCCCLFESIYSLKSQPWPLAIHKVAGSCCDSYFNYLNHNLSQLVNSYNEKQNHNFSLLFPSKTSLREVSLFACLFHKARSTRIEETEIKRERRVIISTAIYHPLRNDTALEILNSALSSQDSFNGFKDNNIMLYAHLQFAIMSAYAEQNGYQHVFASYPYNIEEAGGGKIGN